MKIFLSAHFLQNCKEIARVLPWDTFGKLYILVTVEGWATAH